MTSSLYVYFKQTLLDLKQNHVSYPKKICKNYVYYKEVIQLSSNYNDMNDIVSSCVNDAFDERLIFLFQNDNINSFN